MAMRYYPVVEPSIGALEKKYVDDCLRTGWVGSWGKYIGKFEDAFARLVGVRHAATTSNGTVSLHLILLALGIGAGDEVIVPDFTYVASANAVRYVGATPVFVDCDLDSFNIDPEKIEEKITTRTKAVMVTHIFGNPCRMDRIMPIARRYGIPVIEDAAQAHGTLFQGRAAGSFGRAASFSFFGSKTMTTGEGGMVVTNAEPLSEKIRLLKNQGQSPRRRYYHDVLGYNYRMTNIQAAIGLAQLERLHSILAAKWRIHGWYQKYLAPLADKGLICFQKETPGGKATWWVNAIVLRNASVERLAKKLARSGIDTRPFFVPMHEIPHLKRHGDFPNSRTLSAGGIILPSGVLLNEKDVMRISEKVANILRRMTA